MAKYLSHEITYASNDLSDNVNDLSVLALVGRIDAYLVHVLRRILSRLDYADGTCKI